MSGFFKRPFANLPSRRAFGWTAAVVAVLTLIMGVLSAGSVYRHEIADGASPLWASLVVLVSFVGIGLVLGLYAAFHLLLLYRPTLAAWSFLRALPEHLRRARDAVVGAWYACSEFVCSVPSRLASITGAQWAFGALTSVAILIACGVAFVLWPVASAVTPMMPAFIRHNGDFMDILLVDVLMMVCGLWGLTFVLALLVAVLRVVLKRP